MSFSFRTFCILTSRLDRRAQNRSGFPSLSRKRFSARSSRSRIAAILSRAATVSGGIPVGRIPLSRNSRMIRSWSLVAKVSRSRRRNGEVWGVTCHAVSVVWRRAVARAGYEKECEEKSTKPEPAFLVDLTLRSSSRSHVTVLRKGTEPHGSVGHHRPQDASDAETVYSPESGGFVEIVALIP